MKEILVISGKGGTGKTVITASFAALAGNKIMVDADVDAANLYLLLGGEIKEKNKYIGSKSAFIDKEKCTGCGKCKDICRFSAVENKDNIFYINELSCEGCGSCTIVCPEKAIILKEEETGEWFVSDTKYGPFVHAKLGIAQENSGKLVSVIREKARDIAVEKNSEYVIIDGPPGIGCPVIASLSGVNTALIVTEPSLSGMHDMERVIGVAKHFDIDTKVIINKYDINIENTNSIKKFCEEKNVEVLGQLPFSDIVNQSIIKGVPIVEFCDEEIAKNITNLWERIK